jgi:outer membrane protein assembly factor BamB
MRFRTAIVVLIVTLSLGGVAVYGFTASGGGGGLQTLWVSDTAQPVLSNHHAPAAGRIDGQSVVYAPISGNYSSDQCAFVALDGTTGEQIWNYSIPPKNCTIHSVADPAIADVNEDGTKEVLVETTENRVHGFEGLSGQQLFSYNLTSYGYTKPLVADFVEGEGKEIIAVDTNGTAVVIHSNGTVAWRQHVPGYVNSQPALADFSGDGTTELAVGFGATALVVFDADGTVEWTRSSPLNSTITWMATGQTDEDPPTEIVVANTKGQVVAFDGAEGEIEWKRDFGDFSAVRSLEDGDRDGQPELYVVARDGKLRSLNATTGATEWTTTLDTGDIQVVPAPSLGDVDGDGRPELVSVTNGGVVSVIDPRTGDVLGSYERDVPIWDHPQLADTDGDGADEIYVMYGDGRVAALSAGREPD